MAAYSLCGWWILLLSSMVLIGDTEVFGCLEDEKIALFKLKDVFNHQNATVPKSWSNDEEPDCCRWKRVTCDVFSKRIIKLSLKPYKQLSTQFIDKWFLDASFFQPFEELQNLTIRNGALKGFTGQLKLAKLQVLDLSKNDAISHVPLLGELPSLKILDLRWNAISHGFEELTNLSNLELLNLEGNNYLGEIPQSMWNLTSIWNSTSIWNLTSIWTLTSLKMLGLSENTLTGSLPEGLCALSNLQELDLSFNEFHGVIPICLSNLTSLRVLELSGNKFSGTIPSNIFSSLKLLEYVSLSYNQFDGLFSFGSLADNSKLEVFELDSDNPKLKVDTENVQWKHPIFQLKILLLSNCIVNEPSKGVVPSFLLSQYDLRIVDLSNNGMTGDLPSWLLTNNSRLEILSLKNNSFTGRLTLQLDSSNSDLVSLDVSMNQIAGEIPTFIGSILPSLDYWNMSTNAIEGSIPSSIENMSQLDLLDLSNNRLSGEIPGGLYTRCEVLSYLKLSNNKLSGNILPKNMSKFSPFLYSLYLDRNNFSGGYTHGQLETLPFSLGVGSLDISSNSISGRFPDWILGLSGLTTLDMSKNHFEGKLPSSFCNLTKLIFINLSWNNFSDNFPSCTNLLSLKFLHLQGNRFDGTLPISLSRLSSMVTLDVKDNNFSGLIPAWISSLSHLIILLLKGNIFHGSIPSELCLMENLNILDLAANNLSGSVPSCLYNIPFGKKKVIDFVFETGGMREYQSSYLSYSYENQLHITQYDPPGTERAATVEDEVQFITKSMSGSYKGNVLYFMSGIDLSLNNLTGNIPLLIGNWDMVHSINLSYNHFNGSIPWTLSRLKTLESLDLSHNMLSGKIPSQMTELNFLSVFSVAYNNLSGPTPSMIHQFATFDVESYEGNPLLCGLPLDKNCSGQSPPTHAKPSTGREQNDFSFKTSFLWSFFGSFLVSCIGAFIFFYFSTNVPEILLECIGVEIVPLRRSRTIRFM